MSEGTEKIKSELESTYDIPFTVIEEKLNGEPCYIMGPTPEYKELFNIRVSFSNRIRLNAEFIPDTYGADFIRSMGKRPISDRDIFLEYVGLMEERGAKVTISVNGEDVTEKQFRECSEDWNQLDVKVSKIPVSDEQYFSYSDKALEWGSVMMGMILSMADIVPLEDIQSSQPEGYSEGKKLKATVNRYERNPINRKLCLEKNGYSCCVCGMNFEDIYGPLGHKFIHVHHIVPVSQMGEGYVINPETDLVPVCPNCHAMLHRKDPPYTPEELKEIMKDRAGQTEKDGEMH